MRWLGHILIARGSPPSAAGERARLLPLPFALVIAMTASPASAQYRYEPTAANLAGRTWFQDAKFGLFIHWGVYSLLQDGEWVMQNRGIRVGEYETLAPEFNPTRF